MKIIMFGLNISFMGCKSTVDFEKNKNSQNDHKTELKEV